MGYRSLAECVRDLEATGQLVVIDQEVDPYLEVAAIQRRVYQAGGPALFFRRVKGTAFPMLGNLFGTLERAKFLFRDTLESVRRLVELKVDPGALGKNPWRYRGVPAHALAAAAAAGAVGADPGAPDRASTSCRRSSAGRWTAGRSSRCRRSTPRTPTGPAWRGRTWGCTGSSSPATSTSRTARSACTTRSTAASACTTRRRSGGASRCG